MLQQPKVKTGGRYFKPTSDVARFSSGCSVLDCILGGGWAKRRILNLIGSSGAGKTLVAIESAANFVRAFPKGVVRYREVEKALDLDFAHNIGLPESRLELPQDECLIVEDFYKDLEQFSIRMAKLKVPSYYILDSLDALTDAKESELEFGEATFGLAKAKLMSELFRRLNQRVSAADTTVMIVSQVRDAIGVTFGRKWVTAGGKSLEFYSSQRVYLSKLAKIKKTKDKVTREIGENIKAYMVKMKVGRPYRDCEFPVIYSYGMDDIAAGINFLLSVGRTKAISLTVGEAEEFLKNAGKMDAAAFNDARSLIAEAVKEVWEEIETKFDPPRRKYQ